MLFCLFLCVSMLPCKLLWKISKSASCVVLEKRNLFRYRVQINSIYTKKAFSIIICVYSASFIYKYTKKNVKGSHLASTVNTNDIGRVAYLLCK